MDQSRTLTDPAVGDVNTAALTGLDTRCTRTTAQ